MAHPNNHGPWPGPSWLRPIVNSTSGSRKPLQEPLEEFQNKAELQDRCDYDDEKLLESISIPETDSPLPPLPTNHSRAHYRQQQRQYWFPNQNIHHPQQQRSDTPLEDEGHNQKGDFSNGATERHSLNLLHQPATSTKGLFCLPRIFNVVAVSLILLLCIAVLNLLSWSAWPRTMTSSFPSALASQMDWRKQDAASTGSTPTIASSGSTSSCRGSSADELLSSDDESLSSTLTSGGESDLLECSPFRCEKIHHVYSSATRSRPELPKLAKRIPRPLTLYNETYIDNYRWMHQIQQDPDVEAYIQAESNYTAAWIEYSGIKTLQKQLEYEMNQIRDSIQSQSGLSIAAEDDSSPMKPNVEILEGTQFWDLDRWRYWLDESVGNYGAFKRRPIPRDAYQQAMEEKRQSYMLPFALDYSDSQHSWIEGEEENSAVGVAGGCSTDPVRVTKVQLVLNLNQVAESLKRKDEADQFLFGSIEVQPEHTLLQRVSGPEHDMVVKPKKKDLYVAYTYDTSGDERYYLRVATLPSGGQKSQGEGSVSLATECGCQASSAACDPRSCRDSLDPNNLQVADGVIVKDAGPEMRFVKLGGTLYLYFTRLDSKGLSREVWRVKVDSIEAVGEDEKGAFAKSLKKPYQLEMVYHEKDERNVVSISLTNDQRYLLIESAGQLSSYVCMLSVDNPDKGWSLVRHPEDNALYKVEHHSGFFYLRTNHGGATNFKVLRVPVAFSSDVHSTPLDASERGSSFLSGVEDEVVITHDPEEFLERFEVFVEHFVAWVWRNGLPEIRIFLAPRPGDTSPGFPLKEVHRIRPYHKDFKVVTVMPGNIRDEEQRLFRDFYSTKLRYSNSSFVHPWALFEYDMHSLTASSEAGSGPDSSQSSATKLICQDPFPVGVKYGESASSQQGPFLDRMSVGDLKKEQEKEIAKFKEVRLMVPSKHGSKRNQAGTHDEQQSEILIPVSMVYYAFPDGRQFPRRAAFVSAYGAYGSMTSAEFDPLVTLPLLHRGFLFVKIHPRGDGVLGPGWYADGKVENKMNTFYDVEDVLTYLRDSGMVVKEGCVMEGRSAGGLVSGWIANRWGEAATPPPGGKIGDQVGSGSGNIVREMVKVVLAQVPFVDVIADMSDPNVPWVEFEWSEWGSPLQSREVFEVMKAYSPYDRVRNQPYPPMMIMGGLTDARVNYAEPLKFVAKLRSVDGKTNDCQPLEQKGVEKKESEDDLVQPNGNDNKDEDRDKPKDEGRMCQGKQDTPLLLQMEDGGHFSGNSSLWMAFAMYNLREERVVSDQS